MARIERGKPKPIEVDEIIRLRPRRNVSLEPAGPFGGDMKHPPETCKYRKMDADKVFWTEPSFCVYKCQAKLSCKCFAVFDEGSKNRKKFTAEES
jgi:hypothetical protein